MNKVGLVVNVQPATGTARASLVPHQHVVNLTFAALVLLGAVMTVAYLAWLDSWGAIGIDFRASTWEPGNAILEGRSPYPNAGSIRLNSFPALYPPPYMLLFAPFSLLPFSLATGAWLTALTASMVGALWVVGLRDTRCYVVALLSLPAAATIGAGNATGLLLLSTALLWRWRNRPHYGAAAFAVGLLIKPILWPLFVWLLVTRRIRLALEAAALAPFAALAGWALIGFDGLAEYPALLRAQSDALASNGLLVTNLLLDVGLPLRAAELVSLAIGAVLLIAFSRVKSDVDRFALGVAAGLIITPVMFVHYVVLLYAPLAVKFTRLSPAWFVPMLFWFIAFSYVDGTRPWWTSIVGMVVVVAILASLVRRDARAGVSGPTTA